MRWVAVSFRVVDELRDQDASVAVTQRPDGRWECQLKGGSPLIDRRRDFEDMQAARRWSTEAVARANRALDRLADAKRDVAEIMDAPMNRNGA